MSKELPMDVKHFFDPRTWNLTYVVSKGNDAVVIDSVLDYDPKSARTFTESCDAVEAYLDAKGLTLHWVVDTHPHADHLSGMAHLKAKRGCKTAIGAGIVGVQETWKGLFDLGDWFATDGSQFDRLLADGDVLEAGALQIEVWLTEGHTPGSLTFKVDDAVFVGDLLFMPDQGTARCDFPGGSADAMYESVQRIYALPDETRLFTNHDYQPGGRELRFMATVGELKASNKHLNAATTLEEFKALRAKLEQAKPAPTLLLPAVQVNINGGQLPPPSPNGIAYLKIPLNTVGSDAAARA